MEQRFTYQGEQYEQKDYSYPGKEYVLSGDLPPGENYWTQPVSFDTHDSYPPFKGLEDFRFFYASNTGIPGPFRPRPVRPQTPMFNANGVARLFHDTQELRYSTENGRAPKAPFPNQTEPLIQQYNVVGEAAKENCGCAGGGLFPNM